MTAANRRRGADAERAVVAFLRDNGYPDARRYLAGDGRQPGDIDGVPGLCIEVKDVAASSWPTWCRQADAEAGGRTWVVVRRKRGNPNVAEWPCIAATRWETWRLGARSGLIEPFGEFMAWWRDDDSEVGA